MKGEDMEQKKQEAKGGRGFKLWTGATLAAFLAAAAIYAVLLWVEKNELSSYEKVEVIVAAMDVPEGQLITRENVDQLFTTAMLDKDLVPEAAICDKERLENYVASARIDQGAFLTTGMFRSLDLITAGMREPVVAGFRAEDLSQVVGGVLRAGDRIHVYSQEDDGTFLIWENVYVQQVFDSAGKVIESGDEETSAQRVNVFLDKEDIEAFYTRLGQGTLRVVKIWRKAEIG